MSKARIAILGGKSMLDVEVILRSGNLLYTSVATQKEAVMTVSRGGQQLLVCDLHAVSFSDFALVKELHRVQPGLCIVAVATNPPVAEVVSGMREGIFDCHLRPLAPDAFLASIHKSLDNQKLVTAHENLPRELKERTEDLEEKNRELVVEKEEIRLFNDIARAMTSAPNLDEILRAIVEGIHQVLEFDRIVLSFVNVASGVEEAQLTTGSAADDFCKQTWKIDDPENPWIRQLLQSKTSVVGDPSKEAELAGTPIARLYPTPFLKVPILVRGSVIGSVTADNSRSGKPFSPDGVRRIEMFADLAGIAIENSRLQHDILESREQVLQAQKLLVDAERLAALGAMAASINHEINNPLCAIVLDTQLLMMTLTPEQEKIRKRVESIENSVMRIRSVTEKIAALKRTTVTEYQPKTEMLDINLSSK